jgi:acetyl esterase
LRPTAAFAGVPPNIEQRVRALGPVLDMAEIRALYEPLLASQPRGGVNVHTDIAYGPDSRHRLDIYRPSKASTKALPVIVLFPGGGFVRGDKAERSNAGLLFAHAGYLTVIANYRLAPANLWPAGAEDVSRALQWTQTHAQEHSGDAQRVWLIGESAGAAHVAAATLLRRFHPASGLHIAGAILISGVYNPELEQKARRQFQIATPDPRNDAYFGKSAGALKAMSVVNQIDAPPLPLLITYAELDPLQMQVQAGELFARLVVGHGFTPDLHIVRGHNHLSQVFSFNTGDESLSAPVLKFLASH